MFHVLQTSCCFTYFRRTQNILAIEESHTACLINFRRNPPSHSSCFFGGGFVNTAIVAPTFCWYSSPDGGPLGEGGEEGWALDLVGFGSPAGECRASRGRCNETLCRQKKNKKKWRIKEKQNVVYECVTIVLLLKRKKWILTKTITTTKGGARVSISLLHMINNNKNTNKAWCAHVRMSVL